MCGIGALVASSVRLTSRAAAALNLALAQQRRHNVKTTYNARRRAAAWRAATEAATAATTSTPVTAAASHGANSSCASSSVNERVDERACVCDVSTGVWCVTCVAANAVALAETLLPRGPDAAGFVSFAHNAALQSSSAAAIPETTSSEMSSSSVELKAGPRTVALRPTTAMPLEQARAALYSNVSAATSPNFTEAQKTTPTEGMCSSVRAPPLSLLASVLSLRGDGVPVTQPYSIGANSHSAAESSTQSSEPLWLCYNGEVFGGPLCPPSGGSDTATVAAALATAAALSAP